jgi:ribosomal protein S19E (S16A)
MAIEIKMITICVRKATLEQKYPGGLKGFREDACGFLREDEMLIGFSVMNSLDAEGIVADLEQHGLRLLSENGEEFVDIAIADTLGPSRKCSWLRYRNVDNIGSYSPSYLEWQNSQSHGL